MHLVCPNCGKAHIARAEAIGAEGRNVRCSTCKTIWHVNGAGEPERKQGASPSPGPKSQDFVDQMRNAAAPRPAKPPRPARRRDAKPGVFQKIEPGAVVLGALFFMLGAMFFFRESVVQNVPHLAPLYHAMGFEINVRGLEFADVQIKRDVENGAPVLLVEGKITNITPSTLDVPPIRIALRSPTGAEVGTMTVKPDHGTLQQAGTTIFKTRLANPPSDAKDVLVRFSSTGLNAGG